MKLDIHALAVAACYRYAYGCGSYFYAVITHYLTGFQHHFHFFFGIAVILKHIYMWQHIHIYTVWVHTKAIATCALVFHLLHSFLPGTAYALVSTYHYAFDAVFIVQWF